MRANGQGYVFRLTGPSFAALLHGAKFRKGFTLLEVVVAMAIVGLGVVTLLEIFSSGLRLGSKSSERTEAVLYGRQVMDDALISREARRGREDGSFDNKYRWTLNVDPLREESVLDLSSNWELEEVTLEMGNLLQMKTLRLVSKEGSPLRR
jgi:prepilin-type N-terminal cleavage/methylation domain-containing protein